MNASDIMTRVVCVCGEGESANRAADLMWRNDVGCVPIVDEERRLKAIVTDRDLCMAAYIQGRALQDIPVLSAAAEHVIVGRENDSIGALEKLMSTHQLRRLPIVDGGGHPVGIVSLNDIARRAGRGVDASGVAFTLASICEPTHVATRSPQGGDLNP